jgi:hypothetical protein
MTADPPREPNIRDWQELKPGWPIFPLYGLTTTGGLVARSVYPPFSNRRNS